VVVVVVDGPDPTGLLLAFSAGDAAGRVLVCAVRGGNVVLVVGVVAGVSGCVPLPVSAFVRGLCEPLATAAEVDDDAFPDEGIMGRPDAAPVIGNGSGVGVVYPLAAMASGGRDEESGPSATATTIPTMPSAEVAPTTFCRRRTFVFFRRRMFVFRRRRTFISHPNALPC
jgi:hypothetical protein